MPLVRRRRSERTRRAVRGACLMGQARFVKGTCARDSQVTTNSRGATDTLQDLHAPYRSSADVDRCCLLLELVLATRAGGSRESGYAVELRCIGWCSVLALCVTLASRCCFITSLVLLLVTIGATRCFACLCVAFLPPIVAQKVINTFTLCSHAARYAIPMQLIVVWDPGRRPMRRISRFRSRSDIIFDIIEQMVIEW